MGCSVATSDNPSMAASYYPLLYCAAIKSNLTNYVDSFPVDAREIFENFGFGEFIALLDEANLLFKVVQKVATTNLSPDEISNHDMGLVFEELIRLRCKDVDSLRRRHGFRRWKRRFLASGARLEIDYGNFQ